MNLKVVNNRRIIVWLVCVLLGNWLVVQFFIKVYYFEGDEIVFEFDWCEYKEVFEKGSGEKLEFVDLKIYEVIVFGNVSNWSKDNWCMKKMSCNKY